MKNLFKTMNDKNIRIQNQSAKHQYLAAAVGNHEEHSD